VGRATSQAPPSSPNTTTNPEKIPIKLNTTCTNVNVVIPKIMIFPLPVGKILMIVSNEKILLISIAAQFFREDLFPMFGPDRALPEVPNAALQRPESTPAFYSIFCLFRSRTPTYLWARTRTRYAMRFRCTR